MLEENFEEESSKMSAEEEAEDSLESREMISSSSFLPSKDSKCVNATGLDGEFKESSQSVLLGILLVCKVQSSCKVYERGVQVEEGVLDSEVVSWVWENLEISWDSGRENEGGIFILSKKQDLTKTYKNNGRD